MSTDTIPVNLWLGGRSYRVRVKPSEEELVRAAVKLADEKLMELRNSYAGKDDQDFMAMCLLMYAIEGSLDKHFNPVATGKILDMIATIDTVLEE